MKFVLSKHFKYLNIQNVGEVKANKAEQNKCIIEEWD